MSTTVAGGWPPSPANDPGIRKVLPANYVFYNDPYDGKYHADANGSLGVSGTDYVGTDAAVVLQNAINNGGLTFCRKGTYVFNSRLIPKPNTPTYLKGEGFNNTIFQAASGFTVRGDGSGTTGMIDFYDTTTNPTTYFECSDIGFDLTQNTNTANVRAFSNRAGNPLQHLRLHDLFFDLHNASGDHNAIVMENLGQVAATPSFDIDIRKIYAHNGSGTINLYLNAAGAASTYYDVLIDGVFNIIDVNGIGDDRVAIVGNFPVGPGPAEVRNVVVRNVFVDIATGLTSGLVNGVKVDTGSNCYIHDVLIDGVHHNNGSVLVTGSPIATVVGGSSFLQNLNYRNIFSNNATGSKIMVSRRGADGNPSIVIDGYTARNCQDSTKGLEIFDTQGAAGDEIITLKNISIITSKAAVGNLPVGIMFTGGVSQGASGIVTVDGANLNGYKTGISNNLAEAGTTQATAWSGMFLSHITGPNTGTLFSLATIASTNTVIIRDCPGYNPQGFTTTTPSVPVSTNPQQNTNPYNVLVFILTATGATYTITDTGGNVSASMTLTAGQVVPLDSLAKITPTYSTLTWKWYGL